MRRSAAFGLAVGVLVCTACRSGAPQSKRPAPPPAQIVARAGDLQTLPDVAAETKAAIAADLSALLSGVYERALLPPLPPASPRPGRTPGPPVARPPFGELFTAAARSAAESVPDAFAAGPGATVRRGTVDFGGVVTVQDGTPVEALLTVDLRADGRLAERRSSSVPLRLRQSGRLLCVRTESGWLVAGFDVELTAERAIPGATPTASPRAPGSDAIGRHPPIWALARARWMP